MLTKYFKQDNGGYVLFCLTLLVSYLVIANLFFPTNSLFYVGNQTIILVSKYLCYALLALSVDLVWGYLGILSLGHGAFFALGGYMMGMYLSVQGENGSTILPEFASFINWQSLPWYWQGSDNFLITLLLIMLVPGLLAFIFGYMTFRSRVSGVYLSIITQALTFALMLAFQRNEMGFGGDNGLTNFKYLLGFSITSNGMRVMLLLITLIVVIISYLICYQLIKSKLGKVIIAIRDAEARVRFVGYRVENVKLAVFTFSAVLAGIAGALYVPQVGIITPIEFLPLNSIEIVVWVAVGGRATLYGAIVGAFLVNYCKSLFTVWFPDEWLFALGLLFVLVTLFLPKGIVGLINLTISKKYKLKQLEANI